jgi:protein involved in polysaccharide export with SLBB domain
VTPVVLDSLPQKYGASFQSIEGKLAHASPAAEIGVGDVLQVTIFESATGGLFVPLR